MPGAPNIIVSAAEIDATVQRLGAEIAVDYPGGVLLVGVLKGALIFTADLARRIPDIDVELDFMSISRFAPDSGRVKVLLDLGTDIGGRDVLLVEDIVDTGLSLAYLMGQLQERNPRSLHACALLDRPRRRIVPQAVRYVGIELEDEYVLGYGLHANDLYRNLPFVAAGARDDVADQPDCYVAALYNDADSARKAGGSVHAHGHLKDSTERTEPT